ncbi:MAG: TolC family protein [Bacteroidales bacterium]|nr:TolC family protein [Bacteroidales bacterium]
MRKIILTTLSLLAYFCVNAQQISLENCQDWARQNHPLLKQSGVIDELSALRNQSIGASNLPQIDLTGRATYQSEVTKLNLPLPGFTAPDFAKDQYKLYVDVKQKLYDFGMTSNRRKVEEADRKVAQQQNEADLYKVKETVNSLFFQALMLQENERIANLKIDLLKERLNVIQSAVKNGMGQLNDLDNLKAEQLLTEQQLTEVKAGKKTTADLLSLITGQNIVESAAFVQPSPQIVNPETAIARPELKLFAQQKEKIDANTKLLSNTRLPNLFAFGQAGYGRPGLNMLNDNFKDWYMVGVTLSWNLWDGNKTKHDKSALQKQKQLIDIQQQNFERAVNMSLLQEKNQAEKLTKLLESDAQVVTLKENIAKRSASALDNGTITSADYLRDLNASLQAKVALSIHQLQQLQSQENLKIIKGEN